MATKSEMIKAIEGLPDDASYEDAIEKLYFLHKLERALAAADAGHTITQEEAKRRMAKWLG